MRVLPVSIGMLIAAAAVAGVWMLQVQQPPGASGVSAWSQSDDGAGAKQKQDEGSEASEAQDPDQPATRPDLDPPAAADRKSDRRKMVQQQLEFPTDGRQKVTDADVLDAMRSSPRHAFVPEVRRAWAYEDSAMPIGYGQTISQPYMVGLMTEALQLTPSSKVLEIGTGSGYQASILAHLTSNVYTIEIIEPLAKEAANVLKEQGYTDVKTKRADGYFGWEEEAPFDAIIVTCAAQHLPPPLWDQVKPGGRIVIPIGGTYEVQRLVLIEKTEEGERKSRTITAVRFVPLTRGPDSRVPGGGGGGGGGGGKDQ